jgi:uncharacterized protein involved in exopolysaccharide biosynthesis
MLLRDIAIGGTQMFDGGVGSEPGFSLFTLGTAVLRQRWRILRWALGGMVVAALWAVTRPAVYQSSASFIPQMNDPSRSGIASLASQFGVTVPATSPSQSPEFYARLLKSREILTRIEHDTLVVPELGGARLAFEELFAIKGGTAKTREAKGVGQLARTIDASVAKSVGIVDVSVTTRWPSVSLAIVSKLVAAVNEFNQRTRQSQATAERKFVESRLAVAKSDLRQAEDSLERFLATNRDFSGSAELAFAKERLQRAVTLRQEVFTSLTESYEEVRLREVRDTPVITLVEEPAVAAEPKPRRRVLTTIVGAVLGGLIGTTLVIASAALARRREEGGREVDVFLGTLGEAKGDVLRPARWFRTRSDV